MKSILEFLNRNKFENKINNIIFDLDEDSYSLLDKDFKNILESNNNILNYNIIQESNRTVWISNDNDELQMGDHATQRQDRPVDSGGDGGKRISQYEIINMFRWSWNNIMDMNYDGKLTPFEYQGKLVKSWTTECQAWINNDEEHKGEIKYDGSRTKEMTLWSAWMIEEEGSKVNIIVKTIFRGLFFKHLKVQERIKILRNGQVNEIYR